MPTLQRLFRNPADVNDASAFPSPTKKKERLLHGTLQSSADTFGLVGILAESKGRSTLRISNGRMDRGHRPFYCWFFGNLLAAAKCEERVR